MKVLVISNNCFAKNNSNGRILGCLFKNIPVDDVAQFYIVNGTNDFEVCQNYYHVSDSMAIRSWYSGKGIGNIITDPSEVSTYVQEMSIHRAKYGRTPLTMLCRNIIWARNGWFNKKLKSWLSDFNPDVIVLQAGDAPFMYATARKMAKFLNKPLVLFNTEYYYFVDYNYINRKDNSLLYRLFRTILRKNIRKAISYAEISVYNSDWLKEQYDNEFHTPSTVIYQSSESVPTKRHNHNNPPKIIYAGGLGYKRYEPLSEIAEALYTINNSYKLTVYGMAQTEKAKEILNNTNGLDYKGVVSYSEVLEKINSSDLLVLAESTSPIISRLTAYGFSTKITDYLCSGIPIFGYGPDINVGLSYLKKQNAAMVVNSLSDLTEGLLKVLEDLDFRKQIVDNAIRLAEKNHNASNNSNRFIEILNKAIRHEI